MHQLKKSMFTPMKHLFMTKEFHKAIMKRPTLRNKFLKGRTENNQKNFKLQVNFCKKLLRTTKKSYYSNLDIKKVTDNKTFWKTIIPLFTKRPLKGEELTLLKVAKIFQMILNYVISSMVFSLTLFPNLMSLESINIF